MMRQRMWVQGALCFVLVLWAAIAGAETPAIVDITLRCKFHLSAKQSREAFLFDGDAHTYWEAGEDGSYIQFYKPAGEATLSLLWAKPPALVVLTRWQEGASVAVQAYDPAVSMPESIRMPAETGLYRLCATEGEMAIAELRIHAGQVENFFAAQGYPASPTLDSMDAGYLKPLQRNARLSQRIKWMQQRLVELGYTEEKPDGKFGEKSYVALMTFQRANGLYPTGAYEPATVQMLESPQAIPDREAMPPSKKLPREASAFVGFLCDSVGAGYVFGGVGQISSPTVRGAAARLYPEYAALLKGYASRWDGLRVFDCNGLMKAFLGASEGAIPGGEHTNVNGAVSQWMAEMGPIETMPRLPGLLLLQEDPSMPGSFMHIGAYVGEGQCVHARGHRYGVVKEAMPQLWTHWAKPAWLELDMLEEPETPWPQYMASGDWVMVDSATGEAIPLYSQPMKGSKTKVRIPNYSQLRIESIPEDRHYWREITGTDETGKPVTGYVFARDLSLIQ